MAINRVAFDARHAFNQMERVLEDPAWTDAAASKKARDARIWVVTSWFIHCSEHIFDAIQGDDGDWLTRCYVGRVCQAAPPLGVGKWEFWKSRLRWKLDVERVARPKHVQLLHDALAAMGRAEELYPGTQLPFLRGFPDDEEEDEEWINEDFDRQFEDPYGYGS